MGLPTATEGWAPGHVCCHASDRPTSRFDLVKKRARRHASVSTPAGGLNRDGAAEIWLAGVVRLHLRLQCDEGYLVDKATHRGVAGIVDGDEVLRRSSSAGSARPF